MRRLGLRWAVVAVVVAVGAFIALDVVAKQYLESRGATELARALTAEEAELELGGTPFLPGFLMGRVSSADVSVRGPSGAGGFRVQSVKAQLSDVRFSWRDIYALSRSLFATRTQVTMADPVVIVEIVQHDLQEFLRRHVPEVWDVRITSSGVEIRFVNKRLPQGAQPTEDDLTESARYLPRVVDGKISLSLVGVADVPEGSRRVAARVQNAIDLPRIPAGLRSDVRLGDGVIVVEASGAEVKLTVGEGEE